MERPKRVGVLQAGAEDVQVLIDAEERLAAGEVGADPLVTQTHLVPVEERESPVAEATLVGEGHCDEPSWNIETLLE